ncbi:NACHT domain-containing protein [Massilia sp. CCM 9210]|uniref:NACHT domain-containing protein n=1 Tax=Massilia scottii TaxID=3057166 RepID=UPI0027969B58|nr:NACHT domain-containing protein [Massilia sp. CCM 9210]MDQ1818056.1 NACHT domain-containing protein [Massilia sp. CCM 9210]
MNSKSTGDTFRDYILSMLKSKFPDAYTEGKVAWKNADIVFSMMELGKRIKVAVECKNYNRSLNTSDFSKILSDYQLALDNNDINLLLIVSNRHVEAASRQYIEKARNLRFMTVTELESWLVGLAPYIQALAEEFAADEIHEYYVEGRFEAVEGTAFDNVQAWINSPLTDDTGLAILGGYGLGKSSLAKRVASEQALRYLRAPECERLPILLPLGQVVHETELAGLFGKHFTSRYSLEGYSYKTLMQLNVAGRLLIILDGFDEMKHAMTEHDFRANFREFNKLRAPNAKVLLLGRPNAFTSESSNLLIRGLSRLGDQSFFNSDFPPWKERKLSFFNREEQEVFLDGFLKCKSSELSDKNIRVNRIAEVINDIDDDILQRPVQTRIVGLLAADPNYTFKGISRFQLYNDFVQEVIQRDQEKRARSYIPAADRHRFLCNLAWWSWTKPGIQGTFLREEVPNSLLDGLSDGQAIDYQAKRTEYLISSLTEEKDSNFLYFAHRSFHEFLVASHITSLSKISPVSLSDLNLALNEDVIGFLRESREQNYLDFIYSVLNDEQGLSIRSGIIELLSSSTSLVELIYKKSVSEITSRDVFIVWNSEQNNEHSEEFRLWLGKIITSGQNNSSAAAGFVYLEIIYDMPDAASMIPVEFISRSWERMLSGLNSDSSEFYDEKLNEDAQPLIIQNERFGAIGEILRKQTRKIRLLTGDWVLINAKEIHSILNRWLKTLGFVGLPGNKRIRLIEIPCEFIEKNINQTNVKQFRSIYDRKGDEFILAPSMLHAKKQTSLKTQTKKRMTSSTNSANET